MSTEKILLTITIDTECDHDPAWARSKPLSFHSIIEGIPNRLQPVFESVGAIPTYLLTVEVMENNGCVEVLRSISGRHELATHLHSAFIEPEKKYHDYAGVDSPDCQCHCPPEVESKKLENLTNLFIQRFHKRPVSFRAGRFGAGPNTLEALTQLGYKVDTSVTPHMLWRHPDGNVDFRDAPEQPYFPAAGSIVKPDSLARRPLLEIPVSMKKRWLHKPYWFRPWFSSVTDMKKIAQYHLSRYAHERIIVMNMMFHSMEVIPNASPYTKSEADVRRFLGDLADILSWCRSEGMQFVSAEEVYDEFRRQKLPDGLQ